MQCSLDPMIINKIMFHLQVGWQSLVVLYEHDESLTRLQELLRLPQVVYLIFAFYNSERSDFLRLYILLLLFSIHSEISDFNQALIFLLFRFLIQAALQCFVLPGWNDVF